MSSRYSRLLAPAPVLAAAAVARENSPGAAALRPLIWSDEFNAASHDSPKWGWGQLSWGGTHHNSGCASTIVPGNSYFDSADNLPFGPPTTTRSARSTRPMANAHPAHMIREIRGSKTTLQ